MSKSVLIIDTPTNCFECPCFMEMGWRCQCLLDVDEDVHDGRPPWCPLIEGKKIIPVEWIEAYLTINYPFETPYGTKAYFHDFMKRMIKEWEKENEIDRCR